MVLISDLMPHPTSQRHTGSLHFSTFHHTSLTLATAAGGGEANADGGASGGDVIYSLAVAGTSELIILMLSVRCCVCGRFGTKPSRFEAHLFLSGVECQGGLVN